MTKYIDIDNDPEDDQTVQSDTDNDDNDEYNHDNEAEEEEFEFGFDCNFEDETDDEDEDIKEQQPTIGLTLNKKESQSDNEGDGQMLNNINTLNVALSPSDTSEFTDDDGFVYMDMEIEMDDNKTNTTINASHQHSDHSELQHKDTEILAIDDIDNKISTNKSTESVKSLQLLDSTQSAKGNSAILLYGQYRI
eukprot:CAMPEP_0201568402 /NCGR_PEP_ID=MMETSP0190_2-20130828/9469_1 /ASSEMBLY_ACC=CAM_ASM_000263 /TAXON_ID=37353 /ORGANISM="Rosalina sp." /LENGTH=192 /DNA_ID=CAMNT_0047989481 /DNA_START=41 /DNA_END=619 /DNA_ORIENTATION=+